MIQNFFLCHLCTGQISWTVVPNMPGPVFLSQVKVFKKVTLSTLLGPYQQISDYTERLFMQGQAL
jgi:hypothetical protein